MRLVVAVVLCGAFVATGCGSVSDDTDAAQSIDAASVIDASASELDAPPPECTDPEDCDDGVYCNGAERCVDGSCEDAVAAVDCSDGVACTDDFCDNDLEDCVLVPNHGLCTDPGSPFCDPETGCRDVPCSGVEDCDDGVFCNGPEVCDIPGGEKTGSCKSGSPPFCDDSILCTIDVCDPGTDRCKFAPDHGVCDDGKFCNGDEICDTASGCKDGPDPDPSDGVDCTVDTCVEATDSFDHDPRDELCDNFMFCDGMERCDPAFDCQPGIAVECPPDDACSTDKMCDEDADMCIGDAVFYSVNWSVTDAFGLMSFGGVLTLTCGGEGVVYSEGGICPTADMDYVCHINTTGQVYPATRASPPDFGCPGFAGTPVGGGCSVMDPGDHGSPIWADFRCCI